MSNFIYEYLSRKITEDRDDQYWSFNSFMHGLANTYEEAIEKYKTRLFENGDTLSQYQCVIIKHNLDPIDYSEFYKLDNLSSDELIRIIDDYSEKHVFILDDSYDIIHDYSFFNFDAYDVLENVSQTMYNKAKKYITGKSVIDLYSGYTYIIDDGYKDYLYSFKRLCKKEFIGPTIDLKSIVTDEIVMTNDISRYRIID